MLKVAKARLREVPMKDGRGTIVLDMRVDGKRTQKRLGLYTSGKSRKTAEDKEAWLQAERIKTVELEKVNSGKMGILSDYSNECFVDFFRELYLQEKRDYDSGVTKAKTYQTYKCALLKLEEFTGGSVSFASIDEEWLTAFKNFLIRTLKSPRTQATYFSKIRAGINKAYKKRIIHFNPVNLVPHIKKGESEKVYLIEEELDKLAKTPLDKFDWKEAFLFSCFTGLRLSDVMKLTWKEVLNDTLNFRQRKTDSFEYFPLSKTAIEILNQIKTKSKRTADDDLVFDLQGEAHRGNYIRSWTKKAGINKRVTFHSGRHTFATLLLTKGVDLYTVSKLLGHNDIKTTLIYARVIDKVKDNAVDSLPFINIEKE